MPSSFELQEIAKMPGCKHIPCPERGCNNATSVVSLSHVVERSLYNGKEKVRLCFEQYSTQVNLLESFRGLKAHHKVTAGYINAFLQDTGS